MDTQFVNLLRDSDLSVSRLSLAPSWKREDIINPIGLKTSIEGKVRSDNYWVQENSPYDTSSSDDPNTTVTRLFPSTTVTTSYPFVRPSTTITALIEPKVALTLAPNLSQNGAIPNEDSRDIQVDFSNLFEDSRFPGVDRVESGSHVAYGVKMGGYNGSNSMFATIGQSYALTDNSLFPAGSGLENNRSDYVGQIEATFLDTFYLDYRFQLDEKDFAGERQEAQLAVLQPTYEASVSYLSSAAIAGTNLTTSREQVELNLAKRLNDTWSTAINTRHDLSSNSGLLKAGLAIQYRDECFRATLRGERDLTDRALGGGASTIMFSVGLRNLGGYQTPLLKDDNLFTPFGTRPRI
jgi:LPS-assembly protein